MEKFRKIIPSFIIACGLFAIGWGIKAGFNTVANNSRQVTVRGLAEREVKADKVTWPIVYTLAGNDLPSLYDQISATNEKVISFLKSNGISDAEISADAPNIYDQQSNRYSTQQYKFRFNVTSVIVVTSSNVDVVDSLIKRQAELLKVGVALSTEEYSYRTIYEFTGLNGIKPEMIAEATKNAREAAQKFADDSESTLGKIQSATQGQFSITDRDEYTPSIKNVRVVTTINFFLED